jgi:hypothetical protein
VKAHAHKKDAAAKRPSLSDVAEIDDVPRPLNEVADSDPSYRTLLDNTIELLRTVEEIQGVILEDGNAQSAELRETGKNDTTLNVDIHEPIKSGRPQSVSKKEIADRLETLHRELNDIVQDLPANYSAQREKLLNLTDAVRIGVAKILGPLLNSHIATLPQATYEEKKTLAKWINSELRSFGLAIRLPGCEYPCCVVATTGRNPSVGRFALDYTDEHGRQHHPRSCNTVPPLELMLSEFRRIPHRQRTSPSHNSR